MPNDEKPLAVEVAAAARWSIRSAGGGQASLYFNESAAFNPIEKPLWAWRMIAFLGLRQHSPLGQAVPLGPSGVDVFTGLLREEIRVVYSTVAWSPCFGSAASGCSLNAAFNAMHSCSSASMASSASDGGAAARLAEPLHAAARLPSLVCPKVNHGALHAVS